ncbi:hypothetical protein MUG94_09735 [Arthrobacter gengyunqii]|uniref:AMP-dependent ligase C-terminal domain-containing protein n=1 Tax=Arthrobacter gengyunqii TaxID=2886940 RepID=A0A9X1M1X0_9MICC|nr:hypothetical protein [Arthrobacter gengyunqii]MCC3269167.1 hypothetical protein [Arthrobacter gengyunqii]UOY94873.1 hypothetical protein MUG94_09735 [Arthrobacter gengyunqii]
MESWNFPAQYDNNYFPDPAERYWFRERETMDPELRDEHILGRIRDVMHYAYRTSGFYQRKWDSAGLHPSDIKSLTDFESVPVMTKAEMRLSQAEHPPFGDYLCVPDSDIHHIHGTSGTTGRPTAFGVGRDDWNAIANNHARVLWAMGLRPGDTIFVAAIFSLYLGSWGALAGAERLHCRSFPFGAGAPGMTARAVQWLETVKPAGFYATPSYALRLAEVAEAAGVDPRSFGIRVMFFSGEPGASIPSVRNKITKLYGATVIDTGTMAEMTPFMSAAGTAESPEGMLLWQDIVYHEVCNPSDYKRVPFGDQGTPVYTHLERTSQPMIRLASGDLTRWDMTENACGRTYPRLPDGIYGRIDDMFQIRGENVYPSEIDNVLSGLDGYGGEHQLVISREGSMDELVVRVEYSSELSTASESAVNDFSRRTGDELQRLLGLRVGVDPVPPQTFPRTDHKARRVVDERKLFAHLERRAPMIS